jgi:hypothetical protein
MGNEMNAEVGMRPPARRGQRGRRPGGNAEFGMGDSEGGMWKSEW